MEKYTLRLGKNLEEAKDSLSAFENENILFCKLTDMSCGMPWFPSWMQLVQRQNYSYNFKSLVDGLHINIFALLASLNVHLSAKTVLSNGANPKCQPQERAAWSCRHLQKPPCADASLQVYLTGLWHVEISKRESCSTAYWETQAAVLEHRNSCAFSNLDRTILIKIFGLESYPTLNCR